MCAPFFVVVESPLPKGLRVTPWQAGLVVGDKVAVDVRDIVGNAADHRIVLSGRNLNRFEDDGV